VKGCGLGRSATRAVCARRACPSDEDRLSPLDNRLGANDDLGNIFATRQVVHNFEKNLFKNCAQPASTRATNKRLISDCVERFRRELKFDVFEFEELLVLLHKSVTRFDENFDKCFTVEIGDSADHWESADEFGDKPELDEVFREDALVESTNIGLVGTEFGREADALLANSAFDEFVDACESATTDEQNVGGIDLDEFLVWMLTSTLWWNRCSGSFENLQQCLLDTFAGNVAGDRWVLSFASDLVDFIDVDDAGRGLLDVLVGRLNELEQNILNVFTDVTGFGERSCVGNCERNVQHASKGLRKKRLAATGRTDEEDVRLCEFDVVALRCAVLHPAIMVVNRDGENPLRLFLSNDVVVQEFKNLYRLRKFVERQLAGFGKFLFDDLVTQVDALVADVDTRTSDQFLDLLLGLPAKRALQKFATISELGHVGVPLGLLSLSGRPRLGRSYRRAPGLKSPRR